RPRIDFVHEDPAAVRAGGRDPAGRGGCAMSPRKRSADPLETAIADSLEPGRFLSWRAVASFVRDLEALDEEIWKLVSRGEAERAAGLYETFIAGCHEKADEVHDSGGGFGSFVATLFCRWIAARQAAGAEPADTAAKLVSWMEDDPYGFCQSLEAEAVKAFGRKGLPAFEQEARRRFEAAEGRDYPRRRWGEVLRAILAARRDVSAYLEICERTGLAAGDCLTVARLLESRRKRAEALEWVERGLEIAKKEGGGFRELDLEKMRRGILERLGRRGEALDGAFTEFREHSDEFTYRELMRYVPKRERARWHAKAMEAASGGELASLIGLWLETREIGRLVARIRGAPDEELEGVSHYVAERAASRLERFHPEAAAKLRRALALRILAAKKSKYYPAALAHLERAKRCLERAGAGPEWQALAARIREEHPKKSGFMPEFERLAAGERNPERPFLERARRRWIR
ncbi:MAG: DUF6880 family protein, partial [Candidatus Binatia bacterium]